MSVLRRSTAVYRSLRRTTRGRRVHAGGIDLMQRKGGRRGRRGARANGCALGGRVLTLSSCPSPAGLARVASNRRTSVRVRRLWAWGKNLWTAASWRRSIDSEMFLKIEKQDPSFFRRSLIESAIKRDPLSGQTCEARNGLQTNKEVTRWRVLRATGK